MCPIRGLLHPKVHRRALLLGGITLGGALLVVLGGWLAQGAALTKEYLPPDPPGNFTIDAGDQLAVNEVFDLGVAIANGSHNQHLTLQGVDLPRGLPSHLHLLHEAALAPSDAFVGDRGWPPASLHHPVAAVAGFSVGPNSPVYLALAFSADTPGIYQIGPVVVHAVVTGWLGLPVPIEQTTHQYGMLCAAVSDEQCTVADQAMAQQLRRQGP